LTQFHPKETKNRKQKYLQNYKSISKKKKKSAQKNKKDKERERGHFHSRPKLYTNNKKRGKIKIIHKNYTLVCNQQSKKKYIPPKKVKNIKFTKEEETKDYLKRRRSNHVEST
jgi:hypothetical protein